MKRLLSAIILSFLVSGCGKLGHFGLTWPASLVELKGFPQEEQANVMTAIDELNSRSREPLLVTSQDRQSSVYIYSVTELSKTTTTTVLARATYEPDKCTIEIVDKVAKSLSRLIPIVWHELGHCAGLIHDPTRGEVMFWQATPYTELTSGVVRHFLTQLAASTQ